jgi:5-(carboxyamino)imidazole ribonucleotide synthase
VADRQLEEAYTDIAAAKLLAGASQVITYEFENVDAQITAYLQENAFVPQGSELLRITQHRIREKQTLSKFNIPTVPYEIVSTIEELTAACTKLGFPCVLKTATGGYDGKGQWVLRRADEIPQAFGELSRARTELIVEQFIAFEKELSVIAARNLHGEVRVFPVAENIHVHNILHQSIVPARISNPVAVRAEETAIRIAQALDVVGLIAVEMFLTLDGQIVVNELAPRPHNSGHYTMDACVTSQFEQHIRAICGLPLGDVSLLSPVVMVNILGEHLDRVLAEINRLPSKAKLHLYGKAESKEQRKMGHINFVANTVEAAMSEIDSLRIWKITEGIR